MLGQLVASVWAVVTFTLLLGFLTYRGRVKNAEAKRDEATTLAAEAVQARQKTLEAYDTEVKKFKEHMAQPLVAVMTDEQVDKLGNMLASKLFAANAAVNLTRQ